MTTRTTLQFTVLLAIDEKIDCINSLYECIACIIIGVRGPGPPTIQDWGGPAPTVPTPLLANATHAYIVGTLQKGNCYFN